MHTIYINPVAKQRPTFVNGRALTPLKTRNYEALLYKELKALGHDKIEGFFELEVIFELPRPNKSKYPIPSRSDLDNYIKAFCDSANNVLWDDDRFMSKVTSSKRYSSNKVGKILFSVKSI
jgi:Holliday junction resolvase RusA-like endonuclease